MGNKEIKLLLRGAVIAGLVASACSEARGSNQTVNTAEKPGIMTPVEPTLVPTLPPTSTPEPSLTPTFEPTATFTPTPERFVEEQEVTGQIEMEEAEPISLSFTPVSFTAENAVRFNNHEGTLTLVSWADEYQNEIYQIHSGQHLFKDLPANPLRKFLQDQGSETEQIKKLVGAKVTLEQGGEIGFWRVAAVQKVEHADVPDFMTDAWSVVDKLVAYSLRDGQTPPFETAYAGGGKIFIFCGWENSGTSDWYEYTRFAMLLLPAE